MKGGFKDTKIFWRRQSIAVFRKILYLERIVLFIFLYFCNTIGNGCPGSLA